MYVRTEGNLHLEIHDDEDDHPYVMPDSETEWGLFIDNVEFEDDEDDEETTTIATFKTVADANSALSSLRTAIERDQGWDAIEFKKSLESGARI